MTIEPGHAADWHDDDDHRRKIRLEDVHLSRIERAQVLVDAADDLDHYGITGLTPREIDKVMDWLAGLAERIERGTL